MNQTVTCLQHKYGDSHKLLSIFNTTLGLFIITPLFYAQSQAKNSICLDLDNTWLRFEPRGRPPYNYDARSWFPKFSSHILSNKKEKKKQLHNSSYFGNEMKEMDNYQSKDKN